jgi:hypothetical protein
MSLSNRCIPPLGRPSMLNVGTLGVDVGSGAVVFRPANENEALRGVPTDPSDPSGLETERLRCFRLRDDLFFLMPTAGPLPVFGEPGASVVSLDIALLRAGVAGETVKVVSAGLGTAGSGEGALRPGCTWAVGKGGTLKVGSMAFVLLPNVTAAADLGSGGISGCASFLGTIALSVCGAAGTGGSDVSILRCLGFCPESLRLLMDAASLVLCVAFGVACEGSSSDGCNSDAEGNAVDDVGTGGGRCAGGVWFGCITSATVDNDVPPVVLCDDTELWYVLPENPLESDCRGSDDFVCRSKSKPSSMYSLVISSSMRSSSAAS